MTQSAPLTAEELRTKANDYHMAPSGDGPDAATWNDKPHRLLYDAKNYMLRAADELDRERAAAKALREALARAEPALWIIASSGNADAVAIHAECKAALAGSKP